MAFKFPSRLLVAWSTLAVAGGCSQILGLGDYEVDPSLDGGAGAPSNVGEGGDRSRGGSSNAQAGEASISKGGERAVGQGGRGQAGEGGQPLSVGGSGDAGAAGAPAVGSVVPCDSAQCCTTKGGTAVGVEMLQDGGFELGTPDDGSPWLEDFLMDNAAYVDEAITNDTSLGFMPKKGAYYVYLSGRPGEQASIYSEDLAIPADAGWFELTGYRNFQIDKQDGTNADFGGVAFYDSDGTAVEIPFFWDGTGTDGWGSTNTLWKLFTASWDAAPHQGQTRYLGLRGTSDHYPTTGTPKSSSYLFDEISLKVFRCYQ